MNDYIIDFFNFLSYFSTTVIKMYLLYVHVSISYGKIYIINFFKMILILKPFNYLTFQEVHTCDRTSHHLRHSTCGHTLRGHH